MALDQYQPNMPGRRRRRRNVLVMLGEARFLLDLLARLHDSVSRRDEAAGPLLACAMAARVRLTLDDSALPPEYSGRERYVLKQTEWSRLGAGLHEAKQRFPAGSGKARRLGAAVAAAVGLDPLETELLTFIMAHASDHGIADLWEGLNDANEYNRYVCANPELFSLLLGQDRHEIAERLEPERRLFTTGLIALDDDGDFRLLPKLRKTLCAQSSLPRDPRAALVGTPRAATLPWEAFAHLGKDADRAAALLAEAARNREPGVGMLLYGPPGTGKTAFAATLAARVGLALYPIGETDENGDEPSRDDRFADLRMAQRMLGDRKSVLLLDEAEDLFPPYGIFGAGVSSRVFVHNLLDRMQTPVIWTANNIDQLGEATIRRMMMCIEMRVPTREARTHLWVQIAEEERCGLSAADADALAGDIPAAPAILRSALRGARLAGGGSETARAVATSVARALLGGALPAPELSLGAEYDPALTAADTDLSALACSLAGAGRRPVSLLLSGPPGTGKSAYARHIAHRMGLEVLQKRPSDLLGSFVGESEKQIARAFAEARDSGTFLIFDEADSFLRDRRGARQGWEVSQVNEMLTWMETHTLPFACTTNLVEGLDQASARRFAFRIAFAYLARTQVAAAFRSFFDCAPPSTVLALTCLTPSDFANVRKRLRLLNRSADSDELARLLEAETRGRVNGGRLIGFHGAGQPSS